MKKFFLALLLCSKIFSQETVELDLAEPTDVETLLDSETTAPEPTEAVIEPEETTAPESAEAVTAETEEVTSTPTVESSASPATSMESETTASLEEAAQEIKTEEAPSDDLKSITEDGGGSGEIEVVSKGKVTAEPSKKEEIKEEAKKPVLFDVGSEEKKLLELSKFVQTKITNKEWSEIAKQTKNEKYVVQEGEWLWQISKKLFGTGFYYSKIWAINPYIKNPHEIKPGMVLVFDTGDEDTLPEVKVGTFEEAKGKTTSKTFGESLQDFGDEVEPKWLGERKKLIEQGLYFQFASDENYDDLNQLGKISLIKEWEKYDPPIAEIVITEPGQQYDRVGFDKNSKIVFDYKEGFFLNTFITTNIVEDLGKITAFTKARELIHRFDEIFVEFEESVKPKPGDKFSVYRADGKVSHKVSDRQGFRYTITGQMVVIGKVGNLWKCRVLEITDLVKRGDRVTIYTPKIEKIVQTFTNRKIEAAIIESYTDTVGTLSFGSVVYLDRGRADGVELGNVFETFSFTDEGSGKKISSEPSYKTGELTVVTLTENFSTALITMSNQELDLGTLGYSKTLESVARGKKGESKTKEELKESDLENLDIEMNLDDVSEDLLDDADSIKLTDDELEELEGKEREKSVIKEHEKDLKDLEKLETQILDAEAKVYEERKDQDKYLEDINLQDYETSKVPKEPTLENLNEIEKEIGVKYIDQDLEIKENPFGLTEFDLEEIDRLLNTEVK
jgi:nucleoid-associated protein YgaU